VFIHGSSTGIEIVIRAAGPGATVILPGGVYTMNSVITVDKDVTITTGAGETVSLERDAAFTGGEFFEVSSGSSAKLTLTAAGGGTLTLDGMSYTATSSSLVYVLSGGELEINDGVSLRNNISSYGAVSVLGGAFTMSGGTITNNTAAVGGGGVYLSSGGAFTMLGGTITYNTAGGGGGGGVEVFGGGTFTMLGGTISNNVATVDSLYSAGRGGGGVFMSSGTFTMNGGTISNNQTDRDGGGVYVMSGATFNLNTPAGTGSIASNTATLGGPQVFVDSGGTFKVNGSSATSY
jgi:hypothetical protein